MKKYIEIVKVDKNGNESVAIKDRFDVTGKGMDFIQDLYTKKTKKLPKEKFGRIIDSPEELKSTKVK